MIERPTTAVAIMAKAPRAGEVKTRLCPPLSSDEAAELYHCFLQDKVAQVQAVKGAQPVLSYTPQGEVAFFEGLAPDFLLLPQEGPDLGARLAHTFGELFARGHRIVCAIDSDSPTLPSSYLTRAVTLLGQPEVDLLLGPSEDGGYYLIGLKHLHRELFEGISWSSDRVLHQTRERAAALCLRVVSLPPWYDVDTPEDLARLERDLTADQAIAPHTRRFLLGVLS